MEDGKLNEQIELGDKREKCIYCLFHHRLSDCWFPQTRVETRFY